VVFNTGSGLLYAESLQGLPAVRLERGAAIPRIERQLEEAFDGHRPLVVEDDRLRVAPDEE